MEEAVDEGLEFGGLLGGAFGFFKQPLVIGEEHAVFVEDDAAGEESYLLGGEVAEVGIVFLFGLAEVPFPGEELAGEAVLAVRLLIGGELADLAEDRGELVGAGVEELGVFEGVAGGVASFGGNFFQRVEGDDFAVDVSIFIFADVPEAEGEFLVLGSFSVFVFGGDEDDVDVGVGRFVSMGQ